MCKHAIVIYCLLSQLTSLHALMPVHSPCFQQRACTKSLLRKGQQPELGISFWNNPQEKNTLLLVTALHSKSSAFPSFLMTFPDHLTLFDYFCNVFFFSFPFYKFCLGHSTNVTLAGSSSLLKRTTFCTFTLKNPIKQNYLVKGS